MPEQLSKLSCIKIACFFLFFFLQYRAESKVSSLLFLALIIDQSADRRVRIGWLHDTNLAAHVPQAQSFCCGFHDHPVRRHDAVPGGKMQMT